MRNFLDYFLCWNEINRHEAHRDLQNEANEPELIEEKINLINKITELKNLILELENQKVIAGTPSNIARNTKMIENTLNHHDPARDILRTQIIKNSELEKKKRIKKESVDEKLNQKEVLKLSIANEKEKIKFLNQWRVDDLAIDKKSFLDQERINLKSKNKLLKTQIKANSLKIEELKPKLQVAESLANQIHCKTNK